jgi:hypothetical protein
VDASSIEISAFLAEIGEGELYNPIDFTTKKLSTAENNYTTTEREGLEIFYSFHKDTKEYCMSCKFL